MIENMADFVRTRPLAELVADPRNPRVMSDEMDLHLDASLDAFGLVEPIVVRADGRIVSGHQRVRRLQEIGHSYADVVELPASWDDVAADALMLAMNRLKGRWDPKKLVGLLAELRTSDVNWVSAGFTDMEVQAVLGDLPMPREMGEDEPIEEPKKAPNTNPKMPEGLDLGEVTVFRIGRVWHRIPPALAAALNDRASDMIAEGKGRHEVVHAVIAAFASVNA